MPTAACTGHFSGWKRCLSVAEGEALDLPVKEGLLVQRATNGGPAAAAGIHGGDRVAQAGKRRIAIGGDVITAIDSQKVASQLDVNLVSITNAPVTLSTSPSIAAAKNGHPRQARRAHRELSSSRVGTIIVPHGRSPSLTG